MMAVLKAVRWALSSADKKAARWELLTAVCSVSRRAVLTAAESEPLMVGSTDSPKAAWRAG